MLRAQFQQQRRHSRSPLRQRRPPQQQILCKIAFQIDSDEEELFVHTNSTLQDITDQLVTKITQAHLHKNHQKILIDQQQRAALQGEIKERIESIIENCPDSSYTATKWKVKLKNILEQPPRHKRETHQEQSPQALTISQYKEEGGSGKPSHYFGYNAPAVTVQTQKDIEIIKRAKQLQQSLQKESQVFSRQNTDRKNRLYDQGKKTHAIRQYLYKLREEYLEEQQLNECTFQPKMINTHLRQKSRDKTPTRSEDVFSRLYRQALDKKQKMKTIQKELQERQQDETKNYKFIPSIDECSRQIATLKREASKTQYASIYEDLYQEVFRKEKPAPRTWKFAPTICKKSAEIVTKNRNLYNHSYRQDKDKENNSSKAVAQNKSTKNIKNISQNKNNFLKNYDFLIGQEKSPLRSNHNPLQQIVHSNRSQLEQRLKTNQCSSIEKSQKRRIQTCETQSATTKWQHLIPNNNVFNMGTFSTLQQQSQEEELHSKKAKENLLFFNNPQSNKQIHSDGNSMNQSLEKMRMPTHRPKATPNNDQRKKKHLNPYQFFESIEQKEKNDKKRQVSVPTQPSEQEDHFREMLLRRKDQFFERIFRCLNPSGVGEISSSLILTNHSIPGNLLGIFRPMAEEMKELEVGLDKQEFIWSLSHIFDRLSPEKQHQLMLWSLCLQQGE